MNITESVKKDWMSGQADSNIVEVVCDGPSNQVWPQDVRCQWPTSVFEKVCKCTTGWGGYECNECDFGYVRSGNECVERNPDHLLTRRNFSKLTDEQRRDYFRVVNESKNEQEKRWAVVVREPTRNEVGGTFDLQNVSTYDMLVIHHFLATREADNDKCAGVLQNDIPNFAHENSTFLTWHRYYLLIVEREFHRIAEGLNISDFTLAYWDWTPLGASQIFTTALFGEPDYKNMPEAVTGNLFEGRNWPVICDDHYKEYLKDKEIEMGVKAECDIVRKLCNVSTDRARNQPLQRGFIKFRKGNDNYDKPFLPDEVSMKMALTASVYFGDDGFNQRAEGFVELCTANKGPLCRFHNAKTHNNLHNAVHIYLGGHMRDVPTASNDPTFFLHHANVDRMFEAWLRKFSGNKPPYEPVSGGHPGHNLNDYLVPFFPLKTNADMYNVSYILGFEYDDLPNVNYDDSDFLHPCEFTQDANSDMCDMGGTPGAEKGASPTTGGTSTPTSDAGDRTTPTSDAGDRTTPPPSTNPPGAGSSDFHVPLFLISIAGTCAVLIVSKLSNM